MKKNILLIAGFVLAFTAVSCSLEENAEPVVDSVVPMEFTADAAVTKDRYYRRQCCHMV